MEFSLLHQLREMEKLFHFQKMAGLKDMRMIRYYLKAFISYGQRPIVLKKQQFF
jgi:hypothetical protein